MTRIKFCGITNWEDANRAVELGVDAIGFVFTESPRMISPEAARGIIADLPPFVNRVGVFVNESEKEIRELTDYCRLDCIQIHGDKNINTLNGIGANIIKAFRVENRQILKHIQECNLSSFLLDSYVKNRHGGTGSTFDWDIAKEAKKYGRVILSGGLNNANIAIALEKVQPFGVDVSSGIEDSPGKKNHRKMMQFVDEVRKWDTLIN